MWQRNSLLNLLEKLRRWNLVLELSENGKRSTKNSLGDREPNVLLGSRPKTKEH